MPAIRTLGGFGGIRFARTACGAVVAAAATFGSAGAAEFSTLAPFAGMPSGPVRAKTLDGAPLAIGTEADRPVLIHFFASWCEPCDEELPSLAAFARARHDKLRLIGVNVAEPASHAKKFVARFDLPGEVALDEDKSIAGAFKVRGLPATIVIAPGGGRALAAAGPLDWTSPSTAEALAALGR